MDQNKVLFVDDEPSVLSSIRRAVAEEDYLSFFAGSASEALSIMEKNAFSVVVTDMRMPVMDGLALLKIVKEKYPKTVRVVLSGYTQLSQVLVTINQGEIFKFITKPWTSENELLPTIKQSIDYYNLQIERDTLSETLAAKNAAYQNIFRTMEDKKNQEKSEFRHLYKISTLIFSLWKKHVAAFSDSNTGSQNLLEDDIIHIAEVIYLTYLSQLPAVIETKSASILINEILSTCDNRLSIDHTIKEDPKIKGNHNFITMIFKVLLHTLPKSEKKTTCSLSKNAENKTANQFMFTINLNGYQLKSIEKNRLKIACALLKRIGSFYNIDVSFIAEEIHPCYVEINWTAG
jgi:two-component system, NtrC family, response regulator HupR/HoxA